MFTIQDIQKEFRQLQERGDHSTIVLLLTPLLDNQEVNPGQLGWAFWNICDRLALQRIPDEQLVIQKRFFDFAHRVLGDDRLHWVVSDGTQAMSLVRGGHAKSWVNWYEQSNDVARRIRTNRGVRFESHRAFAYCFTHFREWELARVSLDRMSTLLEEDDTWTNRDFAVCTHLTLQLDYHKLAEDEERFTSARDKLAGSLREWVARTGSEECGQANSSAILGSWDQLNQIRPPSSVVTALGNAACALCRTGEHELCLRFFDDASRLGFQRNRYSNTLYVVALWKTRADQKLIALQLKADSRLASKHLEKLAPELAELIL